MTRGRMTRRQYWTGIAALVAATVVFIVAVATSTQFTSAFIGGGADRDVSPDRMPTDETPSLDELVRLYES